MTKLKQGDPVMIVKRDQTPQDIKSGLYYPHFGGICGKVLKLYGEEVSVLVDRETLQSDVRLRHDEVEKAMRQKWMDGLSNEATGRLTEAEKRFQLNYAVLVSISDVVPDNGATARSSEPEKRPSNEQRREAKAVGQAARAIDPRSGESDVQRAGALPDDTSRSGGGSGSRRTSVQDLDAAEAAEIARRAG